MLVQSFDRIWIVGLIFLGVHLAMLGFLILKSSTVSNWIGYLLMLASAGYVIDAFAHLYLPAYEDLQNIIVLIVVIPWVAGEFSRFGCCLTGSIEDTYGMAFPSIWI